MDRLIFLTRPSESVLSGFVARQRDRPFSYQDVGLTNRSNIADFTSDRYRIRLGQGRDMFEKATSALDRWEMFRLPWIVLHPLNAPVRRGTIVAILARAWGLWFLNASRVVYAINDAGRIERHGFAYGTLEAHVERGEERFCVEWRHDDDSVWFEIHALSRPNHILTKLASPLVRRLQKRFGKQALAAMWEATRR